MSRPGCRDSSSPPEEQKMTNQEECRSSKRIAEMIEENPKKFRKMGVEIESDDDSWSPSEAEAPSPIHTQLVIDNDFSPAFGDCLWNLSAYVEHPNKILSLMNASPCFKRLLTETRKNSALWSCALPTLLEKKHLSNGATLACRLANEEVKTAVDAALIKIQPTWITEPFEFEDADTIQTFLNQVEGSSSNPLISGILQVKATDAACFERALELLTHYGHHLHDVDFGLNFVEASVRLQGRLVQVLTLIPNVKSLGVGIKGCWQPQPGQPRQEILPPTLDDLTTLKIYTFSGARRELITEFFHRLVQLHEKQLTRFACDQYVFENIPLNELEAPLANLLHLEISRGWITSPTDYSMLSNISGLKIQSLYLTGDDIPYNGTTERALYHVRNTLTELRMDNLVGAEFGLDYFYPDDLIEFPKLKQLTVDVNAQSCGLWHIFRDQFINIEHLRFQRSRDSIMPPTPDADMRDQIFCTFPKLKTITWVIDGEKPQVFTRE